MIVALPAAHPRGFTGVVERYLQRSTTLTVGRFDVGTERDVPPVDSVYRRWRLQRPEAPASASTLADCDGFQRVVALVDCTTNDDSERWFEFVPRYADVVRNRPPEHRGLFCLVVSGHAELLPSGGPALQLRHWRGFVDSLDVKILVREAWRVTAARAFGVGQALREALISEFSSGDIELAVHLLDRPLGDLLAPADALTAFGRVRGWSADQVPEWKRGSLLVVDGRERTHPARLAVDDVRLKEVERHIWRAEVEVLFPFIEDERGRVVTEWRGELSLSLQRRSVKTATGQVLDQPDQLELSHIVERLGVLPGTQALRDWLSLLHSVRNDLAHLRPGSREDVLRVAEMALR